MTKSDPAILELLYESDIELPPAVISHNIAGISHPTVKRRLPILTEHGLVVRVEDTAGYYRITELGAQYLNGELEAEDLE